MAQKHTARRTHHNRPQRATSNLQERGAATPFLRQLRATAAATAAGTGHPAPAAEPAPTLSPKVAHLVEDIRRPFMELSDLQGGLQRSAKTLAPRFMKAFGAWQTETGGTFIAFVMVLDPEVPADRAGYRGHSSYQSAEYLRRLMAAKTKPAEDAEDPADRPATPFETLAVVLGTLADYVDMAAVWAAFEKKLRWTPAQIRRLQQRVGESPPSLLGRVTNIQHRRTG